MKKLSGYHKVKRQNVDRRPFLQWGLFVNEKFYPKTNIIYKQDAPSIFDFLNGSSFEPLQHQNAVLNVRKVQVNAIL